MSSGITPKFPEVHVKLTGRDGNAFAIMGRVARALQENGHDEAVKAYTNESISGDYSNLLRVAHAYVTVS